MSRTEIAGLLERVMEAKGPDREIEARVWCALFPDQRVLLDPGSAGRVKREAVYGTIADLDVEGWPDYDGLAGLVDAQPVTASIDAVLTLVERFRDEGIDPTTLLADALDRMGREGFRPSDPLSPQIARYTLIEFLAALTGGDDGK